MCYTHTHTHTHNASSQVVLQFANGAIATIENARFATYGHDTRAEVLGTTGRVQAGPNLASTLVTADKAGYHTTVLREHVERYKYTFALEIQVGEKERVEEGRGVLR